MCIVRGRSTAPRLLHEADHTQAWAAGVGRGAAQQRNQWYNRPTQTGSVVKGIGEGFHSKWLRSERLMVMEVDADHWKTWVHQRLGTPHDQPGAMSLFRAAPEEHLALAKHLTAESKTEEFVAGRGVVVKWERRRRQNHWLDALYNACAAGYMCGVRLVGESGTSGRGRRKRQWTMRTPPGVRAWADLPMRKPPPWPVLRR